MHKESIMPALTYLTKLYILYEYKMTDLQPIQFGFII